jgi:uncharacterized protein (DUF302 family)
MRNIVLAVFVVAATVLAVPAAGAADLITKQSPHSVAVTLDRLEAALTNAGINVLARVDHGASAARVGMELRPTQLLIFGKPEQGTQLMQQAQIIGLDLPMRVLAWQDGDGQVWLAYRTPAVIAADHGVDQPADTIAMMVEGLDRLTNAAIAPVN